MNLQNLLKDNRYIWQNATQKEIIDKLLLKPKQKQLGREKEEKLVVVFGKPQTGKTTLILSLMGVDEKKLSDISTILRAGIRKGNSSTSTAIIYQRSDDDKFGISEHRDDNLLGIPEIKKCSETEFVDYLKDVRKRVEEQKQEDGIVIYIYIPNYFFAAGSEEHGNINILDVPGFASRNEKEKYHVEIILNKYMTAATLNIIVSELNYINELRDFVAPNGDRLERMLYKYIVITTRSYSMENVSKYFSIEKKERKEDFEEFLKDMCDKEFRRIFGDEIPQYFPVDVGDSFKTLLNEKIKDDGDRKYLIDYRNREFDSVRAAIQERRGNGFVSWIKEIKEDVAYYRNEKIVEIQNNIDKIADKILKANKELKKKENQLIKIRGVIHNYEEEKQDLQNKEMGFHKLDIENCVNEGINSLLREHFTEEYEWKSKNLTNNVSDLFAELFNGILCDYLEDNTSIFEGNSYKEKIDEKELEFRTELDKEMNSHKFFKFFNPSNKEKIEIGRKTIKKTLEKCEQELVNGAKQNYKNKIQELEKELNGRWRILETVTSKKIKETKEDIEGKERSKQKMVEDKRNVERRVAQDTELLNNFKYVAHKNFQNQRDEIVNKINKCRSPSDKANYVLLLGLLYKDYEKLEVN